MLKKKYTGFLHKKHSTYSDIKVGQGGEEHCLLQKQAMLKTCQAAGEQKLYSYILKIPETVLQGKGYVSILTILRVYCQASNLLG